jgi:hypothetical protein
MSMAVMAETQVPMPLFLKHLAVNMRR